jgi:hypothetical protein
MTTTAFVIAFMICIPLAWEFYVIVQGEETISRAMRDLGHEWSPFLIYAVSALVGHFWVNFEQSLVNRIGGGELGEVFFVLWIGWAVFWGFRANPHLLPLGPWQSLALIAFGVLVGAFVWSLSPA